MHSGALYLPMDEALFQEQLGWLDRLWEFNATRPSQLEKREALLRELFAEIGEGCYIEPPLHANWGGRHVHFGRNIYANFNLTLVDDTHIYVGDNTMFGPNVVVATAGHPLLPELREQGYQYNAPVHIGRNCWIGAGAILLPGVTVGDNAVIGAGSIVTKDVPPTPWPWGTPAGCCGRSASTTGRFISRTGGSTTVPCGEIQKGSLLEGAFGYVKKTSPMARFFNRLSRPARVVSICWPSTVISGPVCFTRRETGTRSPLVRQGRFLCWPGKEHIPVDGRGGFIALQSTVLLCVLFGGYPCIFDKRADKVGIGIKAGVHSRNCHRIPLAQKLFCPGQPAFDNIFA